MLGLAREGQEEACAFLEVRMAEGPDKEVAEGAMPEFDFGPTWQAAVQRAHQVSGRPFLVGTVKDLLRGVAFDGAGMNAYATSAYADAWRLHASAYAIAVSLSGTVDAAVLRARALDGLGRVARETGRYDQAWHLHVAACKAAEEVFGKASALRPLPLTCAANAISNAGVVCYRQKRYEDARELHTTAMGLRERLGDHRGVASCCGNLALLLDPGDALPLYQRSLAAREQLGDVWGVAGSLRALAETYRKLGQPQEAKACLVRAVPVFAKVHDRLGVAECLETLGLLINQNAAGNSDGDASAATLLGAAMAVRRSINAATDVVMNHVESQSLKGSCPTAWASGEAMTMDDAIGFVNRLAPYEAVTLTVAEAQ
eukprot:gnl/TRDRNA2_/TRDRNA2_91307_c0_seq2.p1 gnl/TRDRNA2_/TRDRNA2_91307_c0~~gnl/TRDRNA2_/TRDRNA2_91307_c0_seq2.p1  ORF type:complete len:372 (+),score=55.48 gnl/TRDRNA2_/TRDRNA2_91307_c0_seq2:395-1510(+)